jgi:ribose-phosphate pyrophosphokinase
MIKLNGHPITPTIFPDKTSQIWKIDKSYFNRVNGKGNTIRWEFEHEGEFMHLAQLRMLMDQEAFGFYLVLELPYLPYARQDKEVTNESTFALRSFCNLVNTLDFDEVRVFDPHNAALTSELLWDTKIAMPNISKIVKEAGNATPVYPDAGAAMRYVAINKVLYCEKIRNQLTGEITGLRVKGKVQKKSYIIIDDICDGGRTFIEVAKKLYAGGAKEVHLYVSHGIFSKGLEPLREAGIKRIFTRKGEVL